MPRKTRPLLSDISPLHAEIIKGDYDEHLDSLVQAIEWRRKSIWRKGMKVRVVNCNTERLNGKEGIVLKVNKVRISVGLGKATKYPYGTTYEDGEYGFPPHMLEAVA
jgi:hypothetical protein